MPVIACLGDSLTGGMFTNGYPTVLQELLNQRQPGQFVVKKHGIAGCDVNAWLSQQLSSPGYRQAIAGGCDAIVLMLGTNDARIGCGFNEQQFSDKMRQLVNRLKSDAPGAQIFLATPTPVAAGDASKMYEPHILHNVYPRLFPQIAASCGASSIDCCSPLGGGGAGQHLFGDGVHLTQAGDRILASTVCEHVVRVSGRGGSPNNMSPPTSPTKSGSAMTAWGANMSPPTSPTKSGSAMTAWGAGNVSPSSQQFREGILAGSSTFQIPSSFGSLRDPSLSMREITPGNMQGLITSSFAMGQAAPVEKVVDIPQVQRFAQNGPQAWQQYMNSPGVGPVRKFAEAPQVQKVAAPQVQNITSQAMPTPRPLLGSQASMAGSPRFNYGARSTAGVMRASTAYGGHVRSGSIERTPVIGRSGSIERTPVMIS
jgi:lysophospholipase L1-like esterase